jgi:hypothetical protein
MTIEDMALKLQSLFPGHVLEFRKIEAENDRYSVFLDENEVNLCWSKECETEFSPELTQSLDKELITMLVGEIKKYMERKGIV